MTEDLRLILSTITSGATGVVRGKALPAKITQRYSAKTEGVPKEYLANHSFMYWGSGKHETVEANGRKVVKSTIDKYFDNKHELWIFANKNLTVNQLQVGKAYSYGTVGRLYDWKGIFVFGWNVLQKYIPILRTKEFGEDKDANYCTENVWETIVNYMELPFMKKDKDGMVSPSRELEYLQSKQAKRSGWELILQWKNGKLEQI